MDHLENYKETNILHWRTTLQSRISSLTPVRSDFEMVTGVAPFIMPIDVFPGCRDVVDLHEGGNDLIIQSDG